MALDSLPQDLDQQHRLDPFRTVRRIATYVFRRTADLKSSNPTPMNASPETTGPSIDIPPVLGTGFSEIVSGITPSLEFTSPALVLLSDMLALPSTLPASPPPALLSPTTRHPSPPMPVELSIGKVSLGPLGNTSFSGSTGMGTISLSGFSLTASGKDCPSVLLPLATMVPSDSKVMSALSESLILKGTPRSLMVIVNSSPWAVSWQFSVSMMIWSIPLTLVPSGSMSMTSPGTSTSLPIAVPPARGPLSTSCGSGTGDALPGGVLVVVPVVPVVLAPVVVPVVPVVVPVVPGVVIVVSVADVVVPVVVPVVLVVLVVVPVVPVVPGVVMMVSV